MRLIRKRIEKHGEGHVDLLPQEEEDMWHVYNLIAKGDLITASSYRSVSKVTATGSSSRSRVAMTSTIKVQAVDFDVQACHIRVKGVNARENEYMKMGQHHTIDLELNKKFTLEKLEWDSLYLERIDQACDPRNIADVAALIMHQGLAHVCLITPSMTIVRAKIEINIPRKRTGGASNHDKAMLRFFDGMIEALVRHLNFDVVKCVIIASPGFIAEDFHKYLFEQVIKRDLKKFMENRAAFVVAHSSSGHKHALQEVLNDSSVSAKVSTSKAYGEVRALDQFFRTLNDNPDQAFYGYHHVLRANEAKAIDTLLLTDSLFRNVDLKQRKRYVALVESARDNGADVKIFSSLHVSGEQLGKLSGVAAILRFPLLGIDDEEFPEDEDAAPPADDGIHNTGFDDESDGDHKSDDDSNSHVTTSMASGTGAGPAGGAVGTLGDDEDDGLTDGDLPVMKVTERLTVLSAGRSSNGSPATLNSPAPSSGALPDFESPRLIQQKSEPGPSPPPQLIPARPSVAASPASGTSATATPLPVGAAAAASVPVLQPLKKKQDDQFYTPNVSAGGSGLQPLKKKQDDQFYTPNANVKGKGAGGSGSAGGSAGAGRGGKPGGAGKGH